MIISSVVSSCWFVFADTYSAVPLLDIWQIDEISPGLMILRIQPFSFICSQCPPWLKQEHYILKGIAYLLNNNNDDDDDDDGDDDDNITCITDKRFNNRNKY